MSMELPADRSQILTEQRLEQSRDLHKMDTRSILACIQQQDEQALLAARRVSDDLAALIDDALPGFCSNGRLIYLGAGTSGRLGVLDASECPPTFHCPAEKVIGIIAGGDGALRKSSEGKEDDWQGAIAELETLQLSSEDTLLGIAAGGSTPWVRGALEWAATLQSKPLIAMLSCAPCSLPVGCDHFLLAAPGPEVLTGSTRMKAGTATKLILNQLSTTLMVRSGKVYSNLMIDLRASNEKLKDRAMRILSELLNLPRSQAGQLLDDAQGRVKTAVVMQRLGLSATDALAWLRLNQDRIDHVLDLHGDAN